MALSIRVVVDYEFPEVPHAGLELVLQLIEYQETIVVPLDQVDLDDGQALSFGVGVLGLEFVGFVPDVDFLPDFLPQGLARVGILFHQQFFQNAQEDGLSIGQLLVERPHTRILLFGYRL